MSHEKGSHTILYLFMYLIHSMILPFEFKISGISDYTKKLHNCVPRRLYRIHSELQSINKILVALCTISGHKKVGITYEFEVSKRSKDGQSAEKSRSLDVISA